MASSKNSKAKKGSSAAAATAKSASKSDKAKKPVKTVAAKPKPVPSKPGAVKPELTTAPAHGATAKRKPKGSDSVGSNKNTHVALPEPMHEEVERPKVKPKLTAADKKFQSGIREVLVRRRDELLSVVQSSRAQMAGKTGDSADVSDRASEGFEDELAAGVIAIEAGQLDDIESAIQRIDEGMYGLCVDCDKPIPQKRLEILPFARRCLPCEGSKQRAPRGAPVGYQEEEAD